jgi:hypothetical protein
MHIPPFQRHPPPSPGPDPEPDDCFCDRRLSDLLPSEIVRQIGFDPGAFVFPPMHSHRRMTDPGARTVESLPPGQRRSRTMDRVHTATFLSTVPPPKVTGWYRVALSDSVAYAYSTFSAPAKVGDGVVVRDGHYGRFGSITEKIEQKIEFTKGAPRISAMDRGWTLADYVKGQAELAQRLVPQLLRKAKCPARLIATEAASWQSRGILRLKVSDPDAANLDEAVALTIQIFSVAVEVVGAE